MQNAVSFVRSFLCEAEQRFGILEVEEMRRALTTGLPEEEARIAGAKLGARK